jgi:large subunit ribosomal protein L31
MKTAIHPAYHQITVTCGSCNSSFVTGSTKPGDMRVEICANCHPLYTGKSKLIDSAGRIDKFQARRETGNQRLAEAADRAAKKAAAEAANVDAE